MFEALATTGDTHLGGEDFDNCLMDHFIKQYKTKTGTNVLQNQCTLGKLQREVEKVKRTLSSQILCNSARVRVSAKPFPFSKDSILSLVWQMYYV